MAINIDHSQQLTLMSCKRRPQINWTWAVPDGDQRTSETAQWMSRPGDSVSSNDYNKHHKRMSMGSTAGADWDEHWEESEWNRRRRTDDISQMLQLTGLNNRHVLNWNLAMSLDIDRAIWRKWYASLVCIYKWPSMVPAYWHLCRKGNNNNLLTFNICK